MAMAPNTFNQLNMKNCFKRIATAMLALALLFSAIPAHAQDMSFSVQITSNPPETNPGTDFGQVVANVGDVITFTRHITESGVINIAWQWKHDPSKLDCSAYPEFDSPDLRCKVLNPGTSTVSISMYPVMADQSKRSIGSNLISVVAEGEASENLPKMQIRDVNFYQKYNGQENTIVFDICNIGNGVYKETEYGTLSFDVSIGDTKDGLGFSEDIEAGKCKNFDRANLLSSFYGFSDLTTGYYTMDVTLKNEINGEKTAPFSKKVYVIDPSQEAPLAIKESSTATTPPAAGYEDEVIVNSEIYSNPFPDTNLKTLEGIAASELYRRAVLGGYPDGQFKGYREVNRAEAAKFLLLARLGTVADIKNSDKFPDVKNGEWYVPFVVTAANKGIIQGYPDGYFRPQNTVNTAEFLKMLTLTFGLSENLGYSYTDVKSNDWFSKYAGIAEKYNLFPDRSTFLNPGKNLTRKEVAIAIYQYLSNR